MIHRPSEYNPLPRIFEIFAAKQRFNINDLNEINRELLKGGVAPENTDELNTILDLLFTTYNDWIKDNVKQAS